MVMMGVDNLPTEFPREASAHFSQALLPFVEALSVPNPNLPFAQQNHYPGMVCVSVCFAAQSMRVFICGLCDV